MSKNLFLEASVLWQYFSWPLISWKSSLFISSWVLWAYLSSILRTDISPYLLHSSSNSYWCARNVPRAHAPNFRSPICLSRVVRPLCSPCSHHQTHPCCIPSWRQKEPTPRLVVVRSTTKSRRRDAASWGNRNTNSLRKNVYKYFEGGWQIWPEIRSQERCDTFTINIILSLSYLPVFIQVTLVVGSFAGRNFRERPWSKLHFSVINFHEWLG